MTGTEKWIYGHGMEWIIMNKKTAIILITICLSAIAVTGCGNKSDTKTGGTTQSDTATVSEDRSADRPADTDTGAGEEEETKVTGGKLRVLVIPGANKQIMDQAARIMAEEGVTLEIDDTYSDYFMQNFLVENGDYDCNYFQHIDYLESFNRKQDLDLVSVGGVHIEPLAIYPGTKRDLNELSDNDTIVIPADETNQSRALMLLQEAGIISVSRSGDYASVSDITGRKNNVQINLSEAQRIPEQSNEAAFLVMNGDVARRMLYTVNMDALYAERADAPEVQRYVNVIATTRDRSTDPSILRLVEVLQSDQIAEYINDNYAGSIIPAK